jgi:hypothetical protein
MQARIVADLVAEMKNLIDRARFEKTKKHESAASLIGEEVIYQLNDKNAFSGVVKKVTYDEQGRATVWIECIPLGALIPAEYEKLVKSPKRDEKGGAE